MKYKTPPLPKVYHHLPNINTYVDPDGYNNTRPINIVNSTNNYYNRNAAVPYFENVSYNITHPDDSLDKEYGMGDETSRIRRLQNGTYF